MWNPRKYALKLLFKDGRLLLPADRPEILQHSEEARKERMREIRKQNINVNMDKRLQKIQNAKELLYVEVSLGNDDTADEISNFMSKHNAPEHASDEGKSTQWNPSGSIQMEFVIDGLTDKQINTLYSFLHKYDKNKVKYDVYER